jgi:tRNA (Thr-GGU) A37 N-methylase
MNSITLKIIGYVDSTVKEQTDESWGEVVAQIVLPPEYRKGLQGIEQFSHALIVTFLHEALFVPSKHLIRRPRGLDSMPEHSFQPNPTALARLTSFVGLHEINQGGKCCAQN